MKRIAVTGGAGFIGSNLARRLLGLGHKVVIVDDFSTGLISNLEGLSCDIREGSISDKTFLDTSLSDCQFVYHLAARGSVPRSIKDPLATFKVNTEGTLNLAEYARLNKCSVIFSSSSSVYGRNDELPKREDMWASPLTPYAASKLAGETLIQSYSKTYKFNSLVLRFFNVFGPYQRPDHDYAAVIPKWIMQAIKGQELTVFGDGLQTRDFTYVDTVVDILVQALDRDFDEPTPVNLAYGNRISLNQCLHELKQIFPNLKVSYLDERAGDVRDSQNDPRILRKLFPNTVPMEFSDGLRKTYEWIRDNKSLNQEAN